MSNYWKTCVEEAVDELAISATPQQLKDLAEWIEGAHDNYGMAHGHDCIPNPLRLENEQLKHSLKIEQDKVICRECNGTGTIISHGPCHSSISQCDRCRGEGKRLR